jgi:hypothetical protein
MLVCIDASTIVTTCVQIAAIEQANRREQNEFTTQMLELGRVLEQELHPSSSSSTHASLHAAGSHAHSKSSQLHSTAGNSTAAAAAAGESEDSEAKRSLNKVTHLMRACRKDCTILLCSGMYVSVHAVCCTVETVASSSSDSNAASVQQLELV